MTKNSQWIVATALAAVLALPVAAGAETDQPAAPARAAPAAAPARAAPAAAPRMAPHIAAPQFSAPRVAAPHVAAPRRAIVPHMAAPQRAVVPHVTPRRDVVHATPHNPASRAATVERRHDNAATRAATPNAATAAKSQRTAAPAAAATATTAAQRRADRVDRRHEQRELRALPASQRAAKREEFRKQHAARDAQRNPGSPQNASGQSNATAQANARAQRRNARRNGGAAVTAQAARQGRFASRFAARNANANVSRIAARSAWRHHHRAGFVPWYGPVFWPYAYSDIFNYAFWPQGYDEGYWDSAYDNFFDGLFWGEEGAPVAYATSAPDAAQPPVSYASVEALCKQPGSGITAWPFADIERKVGLDAHQKELLSDVRAASNKAAGTFKDSCPAQAAFPLTPPGRLLSMTARLGATLDAVRIVKPALDTFYSSLSDEQKERFNALGPSTQVAKAGAESTGSATATAASCQQPKPGLANLPIDKIEDVVAPTDAQETDLDTLQAATEKAVSIMQAACPNETPLTPTGRLDATEQRLQAMIEAANAVKPALDGFYGALSNEQKARFDHLGQELAQAKD